MKKQKSIETPDLVHIEPMLWLPGQGPDQAQIERLKILFSKPDFPLGNYDYFGVSERDELFDDLNTKGIVGVTHGSLRNYLWYLYHQIQNDYEWLSPWFGYLAPQLLDTTRFQDLEWFTLVGQGLIILSLYCPKDETMNYEADFANVLVPWIMSPQYWEHNKFLPLHTYAPLDWKQQWEATELNTSVSMALIMAWRYLPPQSIESWFHSVVIIKDVFWRIHLIIWLLHIWPFFEAGAATLEVLHKGKNKMDDVWIEPYMLQSYGEQSRKEWALVPAENIVALHKAVRQEFTTRRYFEWIDQFAANTGVWNYLQHRMLRFQELYL